MATRMSEVSGTVQEVTTEFEKAVKLVRRIEGAKETHIDEEAANDLIQALSLGPILVKGCYDQDSKRFGPSYTIGDYQAQGELRDVLLGLKGLVSDLKDVLIEKSEVDLRQLQEVADTCRQNACACLGQLAQRLRAATDTMGISTPPTSYISTGPTMSPGLHYSTSHSTHSSSGGTSRMPKTPDAFNQHNLSPGWQGQRTASDEGYSHHRKNTETSLQETYADWASPVSRVYKERDQDELSIRRPSSTALAVDDDLLSPALSNGSGPHLLSPRQQIVSRDSYPSSTHSDRASIPSRQPTTIHNPLQSRPRFDAQDFSPSSLDMTRQHGFGGQSNAGINSIRPQVQDVGYSTLEYVPEPAQQSIPYRPSRQPLDASRSPPPRKPIPPTLSQFDEFTGRPTAINAAREDMPTTMYGQTVPVPPRTQSRTAATTNMSAQSSYQPPVPGSYGVFPQVRQPLRHNPMQAQSNATTSFTPPPITTLPAQAQQTRYPSAGSITNPPQPPTSTGHVMNDSAYVQSAAVVQSPLRQTPTNQSTTSIPVPQNLPLTLPTEANTGSFCKGAYRLFIGLERKAFTASRKPVGYSAWIDYWRCDKCQFEGLMKDVPGPPDKKGRPGKPVKIFDPTIRECDAMSTAVVGPDGRGEGSGGIRYKWTFLAKSHAYLKTLPDGKPDGTLGSFACMFCAAEGQNRGWSSSLASDVMSVRSGRSGSSGTATASTPVFGNLQRFMDHLQMHRRQENWPCAEMQGRMKCVVGRIADRNEDWEVNLLPL